MHRKPFTLGFRKEPIGMPYCPEGFWRKGNIDILCERHGIQVIEDEDKWYQTIEAYIQIFKRKYYGRGI